MLRTLTLGGVAAAALASGCCWRPFCYGPGPSLYNPPPAPLFPRLHPSYWATPPVAPAAVPVSAPIGGPVDCPGCINGVPPGAFPVGAIPTGAMPPTVVPPSAALGGGPQFTPMYFGPTTGAAPMTGSTQLPPPRVGEPPAVAPTGR